MRPIMSAIGTFNYKLCKFLVPVLEPLTNNEYTLKNSHALADELRHLKFNHPVYMASFDITSLYTCIPLDETIDICTRSLIDEDGIFINLNSVELSTMLNLATKNSIFYFNKVLYEQTDGMAMGSCLGPSMANIFLCHYEDIWLQNCPSKFKPIFYRRYIDDTFILFKNPRHIPKFRDYLNQQHPNIEFTSELETDCILNFMDISIKRNQNGSFTTSVFRKSTFTGLATNYLSSVPNIFKMNAVNTLIHRAHKICSSIVLFDKEMDFLTKYFTGNRYPKKVIVLAIRKFRRMMNLPNNTNPNSDNDKKRCYISLPFYGAFSYQIRKDLNKCLRPLYPNVEFRYIFTNKFTISSLFPFKDRAPNELASLVTYLFTCPSCEASYVGKTTMNFTTRVHQHLGKSVTTKKVLKTEPNSAVYQHSISKKHSISEDDFSILNICNNQESLDITEAIQIKLKSPKLNGQFDVADLFTL